MELLNLPAVWFGAFLAGAAIILAAGARLPGLGSTVAARIGVGETSVGLFGLAIITSLPELSVTLTAMRLGAANLAFGNVLGSNNFNLAIAGVMSLLFAGLFSRAHYSRYSRTGILLVVSTLVAGAGVIAGPRMRDPLSLLSFSLPIFVLFVFESRLGEPEPGDPEGDTVAMPSRKDAASALVVFSLLAVLVIAGGIIVSWSAKHIATYEFPSPGGPLVLGETFVGSLLVAVATSLPEVTVAFAAMRRADSPDMALGTLLGSNSFNLVAFAVGAPFMVAGQTGVGSGWSNLSSVNLVNVAGALVLTLVVLGALRRARKGGDARWPAGLMVAVYLTILFVTYRL